METIPEKKLGLLVTEDFQKAEILEAFDLDFLGDKNKTLAEAAREKHLNLDEILSSLESSNNSQEPEFQNWDINRIIDYITEVKFPYIKAKINRVRDLGNQVAMQHSSSLPNIGEIAETFNRLAWEVKKHISNEEEKVFPYIKELDFALQNGKKVDMPVFGTFENPRRVLEHEHRQFGGYLSNIKSLTNNFNPCCQDIAQLKTYYNELQQFHIELKKLFHLENDLIFARASGIEKIVVQT